MDWDYKKYTKEYWKKISQIYDKPVAKASLEVGLTFSLILFFSLFAIRPTVKTITNLQNKIKSKKQTNQKLQTKIDSLKRAQINYQKIKDNLVYLDQSLPAEVSFIPALQKLAYLAAEQDVYLVSGNWEDFKVINSKPSGKLKKVPFNFSAVGDYGSLVKFVDELENIRRYFSLEESSISKKNSQVKDKLKLDVKGSLYNFENEEK